MRNFDARIVFSSLAMMFGLLAGCDNSDPVAPTKAADAKPPANAEVPKLIDVKYDLAVTPAAAEGKDGTATWSIIVPTGGWTMTTDSTLVEDWNHAQAVRVYVTLEQPAANEMVTQAFTTLSESKSGKDVKKAEFSVRRKIRGVDYGGSMPGYSVVKMVPPSGW